MPEKVSKKDKIIQAALKIITKRKNMNFTIREVILDADVNIASVNYYFGTKKKLIQEIERSYMRKLLEIQKILGNTQVPPKERLLLWSQTIYEDVLKNPGLILILNNKLILSEEYDTEIELFIQNHNDSLRSIIREITGIKEEEQINFRVARLNADLIFPLLFMNKFEKIFGFPIQNKILRNKYIDSVIKSIS
jgi:TetR/AcrR family transcriptional regulator, regulator of cefoperazone and chloramphenicol sensitivity